jgi:Sulfotransferase family
MKRVSSPNRLIETGQLFFIHIPKAAGTTFIGILDTRFAISDICPIHWPYERLIQEIPDAKLAEYKFIRGHFPYALVDRLLQRPVCISLLRKPVVRFISEFEQLQKEPLHHLHNELRQLSLAECLKRPDLVAYLANKATRYLGGGPTNIPLWEQKPNLSLAIERLHQLDFLGIVEHFSESLRMFCDTFDFPAIEEYEIKNVSPEQSRRKEIPKEVIEQIADLNREDLALYEHGLRLFNERWSGLLKDGDKTVPCDPINDKIQFNFRLVPPGAGWYVGELHPIHGYIRWSGPSKESSLRFNLKCGVDYNVRVRIVNTVTADILESISMRVNEVPLTLVRSSVEDPDHYIFEGIIPRSAVERNNGSTQIDFIVDRTVRPMDIDPLSTDKRALGICYNLLEITPQ